MAFTTGNRVRVSNQHSQNRNEYGTVKGTGSGTANVRLDGMQDNTFVTFDNNELQISTIPCVIQYASDE